MNDKTDPSTGSSTIDGETFKVLVNDEEQYSIWPAAGDIPAGWRTVGPVGAKDECIAYIEAHWTDMRPRSLRTAMDGASPAKGK